MLSLIFFFFNDTATTEIYTLSLHDALPISYERRIQLLALGAGFPGSLVALILLWTGNSSSGTAWRSEEHTSELQSRLHLVCRLLLEKKKKNNFLLLRFLTASALLLP